MNIIASTTPTKPKVESMVMSEKVTISQRVDRQLNPSKYRNNTGPAPEAPQDSFVSRVGTYVAEKPMRTLTNASNLGFAVPLALGANFSAGHPLVQATVFVGMAGHALNALVTGETSLRESDHGRTVSARKLGTQAMGDLLTAVGLGAALAGAGPVSLVFLGTGTLLATSNDR